MIRLALSVAALLIAADSRAAAPVRDPDWPCQAIKVPEMSLGAHWTGPPIEHLADTWSADPAVKALVERLVQRRVPVEQAQAEIAAFAAAPDGQARLLALFAGLFQTLGEERTAVIDGLDRYGRRQKQLADQVREDADALRALQAKPDADAAAVEAVAQRLTWDTRVFEDRRQMLAAACDVPNVIEQRLFALGRAVQDAMK